MKTMSVKRCGVVAVALLVCFGVSTQRALAEPVLQLYLEGGTYDKKTESWFLDATGSSGGAPFRLWTIGNTGQDPNILNVRLVASYDASFEPLDIVLTPTTTGDNEIFIDNTPPPIPLGPEKGTVDPDGIPGDLPPHGIFNQDNVAFQIFALGDFTKTDSPLTDFNETLGTSKMNLKPGQAQINVYEVQVFGSASPHGALIHFDLYNDIYKAPFSHDAHGTTTIIPSPAAPLVGTICFTLLGMMRPTRRRED